MTEITVSDLRRITDKLFDHLDENGITKVKITEDFYWDVPAENRYDQYEKPTLLSIGQLSDDINELNNMVMGRSTVVSYGFVWLASVLRRVGELSIY